MASVIDAEITGSVFEIKSWYQLKTDEKKIRSGLKIK